MKNRSYIAYAVDYEELRIDEYGYEVPVGCLLIDLTKEQAEKEAKKRNGKVTKAKVTPTLTEPEIKQLRNNGVPVNKNYTYSAIGFDGIPAIFGDQFETLDSVRTLYTQLSQRSVEDFTPHRASRER